MHRITKMILKSTIHLPYLTYQIFSKAINKEKYTDEEHNKVYKKLVNIANKSGKVHLIEEGLDTLPDNNGFILYPNHQGMYDILAIIGTLDRPLATVCKKELENIPYIKQIIKSSGSYAMDREDIRQSMKVISNVTKDVKEGKNFLIFPEGKRSEDGLTLSEFKSGSFKAATKAQAPIVPVALINSAKPFDGNTLEELIVKVVYLEPLYYEDYKDLNTVDIANIIKEKIQYRLNIEYL